MTSFKTRPWRRAAAMAALIFALGNTAAKANLTLYSDERTIWAISTDDNYIRVKSSSWVIPTTDRLTVQFSARATLNNVGQHIRVVIYDHTGYYVSFADWIAPASNTYYYAVFAVNPHQNYSVSLFVQDIQAFPPYSVFYNSHFQLWDGTVPRGIRIN